MNKHLAEFMRKNAVPILFLIICLIGILIAKPQMSFVSQELGRRMVRSTFLVLSLIIPILAGMGINFGIPLGAMAGQIGLVFVTDWGVKGLPGLVLAAEIGRASCRERV